MSDRERIHTKPEPFLTINLVEGDSGFRAECPELGIGIAIGGKNKSEVARRTLGSLAVSHAKGVLSRQQTGKLPETTTPEEIKFSRRVLEAIENHGIKVQDLFK